ncbi:MAG: serine hydrolase [Myxococcales bacterium]|nr:serine hydrolase [Myxococcales bacterium]
MRRRSANSYLGERLLAITLAIMLATTLGSFAACGTAAMSQPTASDDAAPTDSSLSDVAALDDASGDTAVFGDATVNDTTLDDATHDDSTTNGGLYFPPLSSDAWLTTSAASANLDESKLSELVAFVGQNRTTAFVILHRGKIVVEQYWEGWGTHTSEPMFSATKSLTSVLIGIAIDKGLLTLDQSVTSIVGAGWSGASKTQEAAITVRHLLVMTSGLQDSKALKYVTAAGTAWDYNTKAYYVLGDILEKLTGSRTQFTDTHLWKKIGMRDSQWVNLLLGSVKTMKSSARDMARFGMLVLAKGAWNGQVVVKSAYLAEATASSQTLNPAYGLLFWLNGDGGYTLPKLAPKKGTMIPSAPTDMISALGAKDKKIYIVPSLELVVVRHGDAATSKALAGSSFDHELWKRLSAAMK